MTFHYSERIYKLLEYQIKHNAISQFAPPQKKCPSGNGRVITFGQPFVAFPWPDARCATAAGVVTSRAVLRRIDNGECPCRDRRDRHVPWPPRDAVVRSLVCVSPSSACSCRERDTPVCRGVVDAFRRFRRIATAMAMNPTASNDHMVNKVAVCSAVFAGFAYVGYSMAKNVFGRRPGRKTDDCESGQRRGLGSRLTVSVSQVAATRTSVCTSDVCRRPRRPTSCSAIWTTRTATTCS